MSTTAVISIFSSAAFIYYGINCLRSDAMKLEFIRFGLTDQQRILTGILQLLGGIGLLIGLYFSDILAFIASAGLSLLMLLGFGVRLKIKDGLIASSPSLLFALLNLYLAVIFFFQIAG